jgi:hypothetical protein
MKHNVSAMCSAVKLALTLINAEMTQDIMNLDDSTKQALHIAYVSESDLLFRGRTKELAFFNYKDGDIEISIDDGENNTFILNKEQIDAMLAWINHSR